MTTSGGNGNDHADIFMDPGLNKKDATDLMRLIRGGIFESIEEINNLVIFYSKCVRTGNMDGIRDIANKENAKAALKGRAADLTLMYGTQTIAPDVILDTTNGNSNGKLSRLFRRNKRTDNNNRNGYHTPVDSGVGND